MYELNDTLDKKEELCEWLQGYEYEVHGKDSGEYSYLDEASICITVKDNTGKDSMYIDLEEEFTLSFGAYHEHYDCTQEDYDSLVEMMEGFLKGEICSASIYWHDENGIKWLGSCTLRDEDVQKNSIKKNFEWVYQRKEFRQKLRDFGGEVHYDYWNAESNRVININPVKEEGKA